MKNLECIKLLILWSRVESSRILCIALKLSFWPNCVSAK